jgi:metallo-beta-lactamase class B
VEQDPFRIFGNTYYVGVRGLSAILITTDEGHILLDGGLPQSAVLIDANIRKLGFHTEDIRLIGNSHAHFDHAGGLAALQRASGATIVASPSAARALRDGMPTPDDPQFAYGDGFPSVADVRVVEDGETSSVGNQEITVHFTPGHTPGGTSWTWRSCEGDGDGARCLDMVYADSLTAVSAPGYRFTGDETHSGIVEMLRGTIAAVANLPCDIMVSTHPEFSNLFDKLERRERDGDGDADALIDENGCRDYAAGATKSLQKRIETEMSTARD